MIEAFAADRLTGPLRAPVTKVDVTSPMTADVQCTLSRGGRVVGPSALGRAAFQAGVWQVSLATMCALAAMGDDVPLAGPCPSSASDPSGSQ